MSSVKVENVVDSADPFSRTIPLGWAYQDRQWMNSDHMLINNNTGAGRSQKKVDEPSLAKDPFKNKDGRGFPAHSFLDWMVAQRISLAISKAMAPKYANLPAQHRCSSPVRTMEPSMLIHPGHVVLSCN